MLPAIFVAAALLGAPEEPIQAQFFTEPQVGKPLYEPYRRGVRPGLSRGLPRDRGYVAPRDTARSVQGSRPFRARR